MAGGEVVEDDEREVVVRGPSEVVDGVDGGVDEM